MKVRMLALSAVVAATAVLAGGATAGDRFDTKVTIKGEGGDYFGLVKSSNPGKCVRDRLVLVYKMNGDKPKPKDDQKIGSDTAARDGEWSIGNSGFKEGEFYAKVKKTDRCSGDISKVISR